MKVDLDKIKQKKTIKELLEFGIINVDKPSGPTSFDVSDRVRRVLGARKTSHFGTLDPKVTGVLPIAINRACKLTGFFLGEDKEYVGTMRIHGLVKKDKIEATIKEKFTGVITQLPPVKSRVKRQHREREIKKFEILEISEDETGVTVLFQVECQGGTYIRKLVHDLGEALGIGAHMTELRRVRAGVFTEAKSVKLHDLERAVGEHAEGDESALRALLIPGEIVSELFPVMEIKRNSVERILHGQPIYNEDLKGKTDEGKRKKDEKVCVFSEDKFIGVFKVVNEGRVFARGEFVLQPI